MKKELLPGLRVKDASVFDLEPGLRVYDRATSRHGTISDIRETGYEVIEAFIQLDGDINETPAWKMPFTIIIGESA